MRGGPHNCCGLVGQQRWLLRITPDTVACTNAAYSGRSKAAAGPRPRSQPWRTATWVVGWARARQPEVAGDPAPTGRRLRRGRLRWRVHHLSMPVQPRASGALSTATDLAPDPPITYRRARICPGTQLAAAGPQVYLWSFAKLIFQVAQNVGQERRSGNVSQTPSRVLIGSIAK